MKNRGIAIRMSLALCALPVAALCGDSRTNVWTYYKNGSAYGIRKGGWTIPINGTINNGLLTVVADNTYVKLAGSGDLDLWDVAVDIRSGSPTFGKSVSCELTAENGRQFFIPRGFAHGFVVLEDETLFSYKCDNLYCRESERGLRFDDPALGIRWPWPGRDYLLSEKDVKHPFLNEIEPWEESK